MKLKPLTLDKFTAYIEAENQKTQQIKIRNHITISNESIGAAWEKWIHGRRVPMLLNPKRVRSTGNFK